jgi:hypothetical protein
MDLPPGVEFAEDHPPRRTRRQAEIDELADVEYVIDRRMKHAVNEDGDGYLLRVRWAGYDRGSETWEPAKALPAALLRKYERKHKLSSGEFPQRPSIE